MRRSIILVVTVLGVLVVAGCHWSSPRFTPDGSGHNTVESSIGVANVGQLTTAFTASVPASGALSSPVVSGDRVYVSTWSTTGPGLAAFDLTPTGCPGAPASCPPLWTSDAGIAFGQATVAGGYVVVSRGTELVAYDAEGVDGCEQQEGGRRCEPLWSAPAAAGSPVVVGDRVFVSRGLSVLVFDLDGVEGCSDGGASQPDVCSSLRSYQVPASGPEPTISIPAIGGDVLAVGFSNGGSSSNVVELDGGIVAFDAAGSVGCSGSPIVCVPTWFGNAPGSVTHSPAVIDGRVHASYYSKIFDGFENSSGKGGAVTFDIATCDADLDGTCAPAWRGLVHSQVTFDGGVAVADGLVHVSSGGGTATFAAAGCGSATCGPLRRYATGTTSGWPASFDPAVANGVLYAYGSAFDVAGSAGCAGTPSVCQPLWTGSVDPGVTPGATIVSNGRVVTFNRPAPFAATALLTVHELP